MRRTLVLFALLALPAMGPPLGCATSRAVLDIAIDPGENAARGRAVKLVRVSDRRAFALQPAGYSTPSLMDGAIDDPALTARAIGRKSNSYGEPLGDLLLPEGRSVEQLVRDALTRGLRGAGFRVLQPGEPGHAQAEALEADIEKLWAWFSIGLPQAKLEFLARVQVTGEHAPFDAGESFSGYARQPIRAATEGAWTRAVNAGLADLVLQVRTRFPPEVSAGP